ncbi:MAG: cell division protein FtsB, partial [Pseudomonadales bacterium]
MTTPAEQESLASSLLQRRWFWLAVVLLLVMFASLQYRLWFAEGSLPHTAALEERLAKQQMTNSA